MHKYISAYSAVAALQPEHPLITFRPHALARAVRPFVEDFAATSLFAVKTNPDEHVLRALWEHGIRHFDAASLHEVALIHGLFPDASIYFMHTVKSPHAIREAYFRYGVRHFSLDCHEELEKILTATDHADDLGLHVRIAFDNSHAAIALDRKFGIAPEEAIALIHATRAVADHMGVCFHVGSQCMHPDAYRHAIRTAIALVNEAAITLDSFDVGGGFPSIYPGMTPPPMQRYFDAIHEETHDFLSMHKNCQLLAEPGRALVAESASTIVRVDMRKGNFLYINDGTYGTLFDAGTPGFVFPTRLLRSPQSATLEAFQLYGPTCDSMDVMKGPFMLPEDIRTGDYIEVGQLGAYGRTMATHFNGFAPSHQLLVLEDEPLMSMHTTIEPMRKQHERSA